MVPDAAYGRMTTARRAITPAAMVSAGPANPHDTQEKRACVGRLRLSMHPQAGHVRLVLRGSTRTTGTPASRALYSTNDRSCALLLAWMLLAQASARNARPVHYTLTGIPVLDAQPVLVELFADDPIAAVVAQTPVRNIADVNGLAP